MICNFFIRESSVEGGNPSLAAAPFGPDTRPRHSVSADSMIWRSSLDTLMFSLCVDSDLACLLAPDNHALSTQKVSSELTITDLSTTFCNSRMLPGHS